MVSGNAPFSWMLTRSLRHDSIVFACNPCRANSITLALEGSSCLRSISHKLLPRSRRLRINLTFLPTAKMSLQRIEELEFVHVLDTNKNVTRVEQGPQRLTLLDHERVTVGPERMVVIPPRHYCIIVNPVERDAQGQIVRDPKTGESKCRHGEQEVRFSQRPFPLYPMEKLLAGGIQPLKIIQANKALVLTAHRDILDENVKGVISKKIDVLPAEGAGVIDIKEKEKIKHDARVEPVKRAAGEQWIVHGPTTYIPQPFVTIVREIEAIVISPFGSPGIHIEAERNLTDQLGNTRLIGEKWLVTTAGTYLPGPYEKVLARATAYAITPSEGIYLAATRSFTDAYGVERKAGDEWLVHPDMSRFHVVNVHETFKDFAKAIVLSKREYCIVDNPVDEKGKVQLGFRTLVKGPKVFFLQAGEAIVKDKKNNREIREAIILRENRCLEMKAFSEMEEVGMLGMKIKRRPGDTWMVYGPCKYYPDVNATVLKEHTAFFSIPGCIHLFNFRAVVFNLFLLFWLACLLYYYTSSSSTTSTSTTSSPPSSGVILVTDSVPTIDL